MKLIGYPRENMGLKINLVKTEDCRWLRRTKPEDLKDGHRMMSTKKSQAIAGGELRASLVGDSMSQENSLPMDNFAEGATR